MPSQKLKRNGYIVGRLLTSEADENKGVAKRMLYLAKEHSLLSKARSGLRKLWSMNRPRQR
jgi:hypothetical protein